MVSPCANTGRSRELFFSGLDFPVDHLRSWWNYFPYSDLLAPLRHRPRATEGGKDLGAINASWSSLCCSLQGGPYMVESSSLKFLKAIPGCVRHCFDLCITTAWEAIVIPAPWTPPVLSHIWKIFPALFKNTKPSLFFLIDFSERIITEIFLLLFLF